MTDHLTFDEERHAFFWKGQPTPSITQVLKAEGCIDDQWYTEEGRVRGTYVHFATELHDRAPERQIQIDPALEGYYQAYLRFKQDTGFLPIPELIEAKLYSAAYDFAGIPDRAGLLNGNKVIIDLKTGAVDEEVVKLQTAAQEILMAEHGPFSARYALQLKTDGSYRLFGPWIHIQDKDDFKQLRRSLSVKLRRGFITWEQITGKEPSQ